MKTNDAALTVRRAEVYEEAAKVAEYTGASLTGEGAAETRERLLLTDAALDDLGRFWEEAATAADATLFEWLARGGAAELDGETVYRAELRLGALFDEGMRKSAESALRSYFVYSVLARWFALQGADAAANCADQAAAFMAAAQRLLRGRRRHVRLRQRWL